MIKQASLLLKKLHTLKEDDIPILIPTFNLVSYAKFMVDQLDSYGIDKYIICDNNSTYQPMIDYLDEISQNKMIVRFTENLGPRVFGERPEFMAILPEYFIVTDPDLIFNPELPKNFISKMKRVIDTYNVSKAGFAIDIDQTKDKFFNAAQVRIWEGSYWLNKIDLYPEKDPVYSAPIDTTFCLYKKSIFIKELMEKRKGITATSAVRIAGRFTCQHMGWWKEQPLTPEEELYYNSSQVWASTQNEKKRLGYL
jgi:hypothetical protein